MKKKNFFEIRQKNRERFNIIKTNAEFLITDNSLSLFMLYSGFERELPAKEIIFRHSLAINSLSALSNALNNIATQIEIMSKNMNEDLEQYMESYYGTKH